MICAVNCLPAPRVEKESMERHAHNELGGSAPSAVRCKHMLADAAGEPGKRPQLPTLARCFSLSPSLTDADGRADELVSVGLINSP